MTASLQRFIYRWLFLIALCLAAPAIAAAQGDGYVEGGAPVQTAGVKPSLLRDVGLEQKLNNSIPLDLTFRDELGQPVTLGQFFGNRPVILTLVYYQCPMLCTEVLNGLMNSMKQLPLEVGKDFEVVTVSIDPSEKPRVAKIKHEIYAGLYGRPGAEHGWHFLTGDEPQIKQLAQSVGFHYAYDRDSGQFAHPSAIMVLTPKGKLARYFYGITYPSRDLRLGLVEASANKIGSPVDQILLCCYSYNPANGKYGFLIWRVIQVSGAITVLGMAILITVLLRREHYGLPGPNA